MGQAGGGGRWRAGLAGTGGWSVQALAGWAGRRSALLTLSVYVGRVELLPGGARGLLSSQYGSQPSFSVQNVSHESIPLQASCSFANCIYYEQNISQFNGFTS